MTEVNFYEDRVIAFIDILGFSDHVKATVKDPKRVKQIHQTLKRISSIKEENYKGVLSQYGLGKEVSVFSDSIVISYPLALESACFYLLLDITHIQLDMMQLGILMRGGVTVGELYHNDNIVYGPAMIKAYQLESKGAIYPRVIVDKKVIENGIKNAINPPKIELSHINDLLKVDEDKQIFVDYMSQWSEVNDNYVYVEALKTTKSLIENQLESITDPGVLQKYIWLKRYYNNTVDKLKPKYSEGLYLDN